MRSVISWRSSNRNRNFRIGDVIAVFAAVLFRHIHALKPGSKSDSRHSNNGHAAIENQGP